MVGLWALALLCLTYDIRLRPVSAARDRRVVRAAKRGERIVGCRRPKDEPEGYLEWHTWAERKSKTHKQVRCREHGLFHVWLPKRRAPSSGDEQA